MEGEREGHLVKILRSVGYTFALVALATALSAQPSKPLTSDFRQLRGAQGNAWSAAVVAINGTSAALDTQFAANCSAFGNTSAAATLTVQVSADGTNFYSTGTNTGSVTGNFGINFTTAARHVRLISNAAATITATLQCKT